MNVLNPIGRGRRRSDMGLGNEVHYSEDVSIADTSRPIFEQKMLTHDIIRGQNWPGMHSTGAYTANTGQRCANPF